MPGYLDGPRPLPVAHRGGAHLPGNEDVENTVAAFRRAHELGFRYLETDVHASADGVVYAFHDVDLQRLTGEPTAIADVTSDVVDAVRLGGTEPIPRLDELLAAFPDCRFNIDLKSDDVVEAALAVVRAASASDRVCFGSFSHARLTRFRRLAPEIATSMSPPEIAALRLGPVRAVWGWGARRGARCVQAPARRGAIPVVTPGFLRRTHRLGHPVHVWTIDDPAEMHALLDLGVDGIMTDRPDVLRDVLMARGAWTEPA